MPNEKALRLERKREKELLKIDKKIRKALDVFRNQTATITSLELYIQGEKRKEEIQEYLDKDPSHTKQELIEDEKEAQKKLINNAIKNVEYAISLIEDNKRKSDAAKEFVFEASTFIFEAIRDKWLPELEKLPITYTFLKEIHKGIIGGCESLCVFDFF